LAFERLTGNNFRFSGERSIPNMKRSFLASRGNMAGLKPETRIFLSIGPPDAFGGIRCAIARYKRRRQL
jgi:hypothetical protein